MHADSGTIAAIRAARARHRYLAVLLLTAFMLAVLLHASLASAHEVDSDASFSGGHAPPGSATSSARLDDSHRSLTTRFQSFDGEMLSVSFTLPATAGATSLREFGISDVELDAMMRACVAARACDQAAFDAQTTRYYREHALRLREVPGQSPRLYVDVAQVVQRNRARVQPLATALRRLAAERGADPQWTINAAVALVQTGLVYRKPAQREDGRRILGFYPPPRALEQGYGDCDTKSALLAALLQNLTNAPIVGVHVPQHYLLGIAATPAAGQSFVRYDGKPYVLVEASGPGQRRPGDVANTTQLALDQRDGVRIDPMF